VIPEPVQSWLRNHDFGAITDTRSVGGGCINTGMILETRSGKTFFLKVNRSTPADMFTREAEGLQALCVDKGLRVPAPFLWGESFILLEDLNPASPKKDYWVEFGHGLASLHENTESKFGFSHDNYIGSNPQINPWTEDGYYFFSEYRLSYQAHMAHEGGQLESEYVLQVEKLGSRLTEIIPEQPPSLIHGDLWTGNAISDRLGAPAIIDPATYYGWAEADLAMTTLFGSFPEEFYRAYEEKRPLTPGYRERFPIYNLYHLLNHLNLFGRSYLGQVMSILRRYG